MPKIKIARKPADTDMTPFVDIAFLILSFFIMATKFKPQEPVPIDTPNSVSSQALPDNNAVMVSIDKDNKVYFSIMSKKDPALLQQVITRAGELRGIPIAPAAAARYQDGNMIGVPFSKLQAYLELPLDQQAKVNMEGIPVADSANNELNYWIAAAKQVFVGEPLKYLIKGDGTSKYPSFKSVIEALKKNDEQKYNLVTMPEEAPQGSDLYRDRLAGKKTK